MVIFIRKGSKASEETKEKIRRNHWAYSENADEIKKRISKQNKGQIPPNKGQKASPETCEKLSKSLKGKPAWNKGLTGIYSEESLEQMSISHKDKPPWNKGIPRTWDSVGFRGRSHTAETKVKMSLNRSGPKNSNWRGGKSFEPYCHKFNEEFKEYIRNKFERKCYICGISEEDQLPDAKKKHRLYIHHVDYNKNDICNGYSWAFIPLCSPCHSKTNGNRWYWFNKYMNYWVYDYIDFTNTLTLIN